MKRKNMNAFLACLFLFSGCDIIDYHPYDVRIKGETDINAKNIEKRQNYHPVRCYGRFATLV